MPAPLPDARLAAALKDHIPALAELYDRANHSLDPLGKESIEAERLFEIEVATWRDSFLNSEVGATYGHDLRTFRRMMILLCKGYLRARDRTTTLPAASGPESPVPPP